MTNEKQKPTTNEYRQNWDEIFDKNLNEKKEKTVDVDIEAENGDASITVTKTWSF